ncbi:iron uptake transporter permease EfeU [Agromyces seonyuensis]|uniref:High-affinity Fe2+/Pb2+ permease n=1 Tax=Agromyces seonyuensis TaxID=2662446 RepID=A0A6I4NZJ1_9MICO|nr:high-affinity Fe2+/Pb2+ permease [Agromyces seonyuensis]
MLANALIGLREGLEAALVVGILVAYLRKIGRTDLLGRLWIGIGFAIAVSFGIGALLTWGPYGLSFQAQEILGGVLSILAVVLVTWMIFWMGAHGATLSKELRAQVDVAAERSGWAIVILGVVSVGREGIETALFVWANLAGSTDPLAGFLGAIGGILVAVLIAWLLQRGLVRFPLGTFFTWTGAILVIVAAGVLAYGVGDLQEASVLPGWGVPAYSLATVIPPTSLPGVILGGIFNFTPEPTWLQVIAWVGYVVVTLTVYLVVVRRRHRPAASVRNATTAPQNQERTA